MKKSANTKATGKAKRKPPPTAWKPGQSGNPRGAPKRGESWQEIYKKVGDMTPKEAADYCTAVAGQLSKIGTQVTLKEAVVLRVYAALLFEPDARLLNVVMDRDEGKVADKHQIQIDWREQARQDGHDPDEIFRKLVAAALDRIRSGGSVANGEDSGGNSNG